ncbi:MAG: hypothetical protein LBQ12_13470 [Deltaproteobacteria bacterium]|jgi:hypothetical protein|nr:hypothetical protein [Deltaproteobacteria bacterium]
MKTALKLAACLALALSLAACGDAKLDTADAQAFTASIQQMYDSTQGKEREDFLKYFFIAMNGRSDLITMSVLSSDEIARLNSFFNVIQSRKRPEDLAALNGMTVGQVIELGRGLKVTYLEGRLQELQREMDQLKVPADFYSGYSEQLERVELVPLAVAEPSAGEDGKTAEAKVTVTVKNGSDMNVTALRRPDGSVPWQVEISLGESRVRVPVPDAGFEGPDGKPAFPVAAGQEAALTIKADVSSADWPFPPEIPLSAAFPEGIEACLDGCDKVAESQDSHRRLQELERHHALLTRELAETRA